jgi:hypothetical protein
MEYINKKISPYAKVAVKLLQGAVFEDQKEIWDEMIKYQVEIAQYFEKIALDLIIDKRDGYAFLKQIEIDDKGNTIGLVRRMPLSYELTLVCVSLREWLDEFDANDTESRNLYITPKLFRERLEMFFKEKANEVKFIKELNRFLAETEKLGFIKMVNENVLDHDENQYEVRRIIKARFTNDELVKFKNLMENDV